MSLLLDTHTFLWFVGADAALSKTARQRVEDDTPVRLVSVASLWEAAIKASMGRLELRRAIPELVTRDVEGNGFTLLPILPIHLSVVAGLPFHHRDPFDRMLVVQAVAEGLTLVSRDAALDVYGVERLW